MAYSDPSIEDDAILRYGFRNATHYPASSASSTVRRRLDAIQELDLGYGNRHGSTVRGGSTPGRALFNDPVSALDDDDFLYGGAVRFSGGGSTATTMGPTSRRSASSFGTSTSRFSTATRMTTDEADPSFGVRGHEALFGTSPQAMPEGTADSPMPTAPPATRAFLPQQTPPRDTSRKASHSTPTPVRGAAAVAEEIDFTAGDASVHYRSAARPRPSSSPRRPSESPQTTTKPHESPQVKRFLSAMRTAVEPDSPLPRMPSNPTGDSTSHPHIMSRTFRLSVDRAALKASQYASQYVTSETGSLPLLCEVERVLTTIPTDESPASNGSTADGTAGGEGYGAPSFSHEAEISTVVNIGDAAHCRVIELRAAFSSEREAQLAMLNATTTLVSTLNDELSVVIPAHFIEEGDQQQEQDQRDSTPVEQTFDGDTESIRRLREEVADALGPQHDQPRRPMRTSLESSDDDEPRPQRSTQPAREEEPDNVTQEDDAFEAGKKLIPMCDEVSRREVNSVLAHCSNVTAAGARNITEILKSLLTEASGKAIVPSPVQSNAEKGWNAAQTLGVREAEAKASGNLALCAQLRRELITTLHDALNQALDAAESAEAPFTALSPARRLTHTLLTRAKKDCDKHYAFLADEHRETLQRLVEEQQRRQQLKEASDVHGRSTFHFLADNDRDIQRILTQIDDLYEQLDAAVYARNNRVKVFMRQRGSDAYHIERVNVAIAKHEEKLTHVADRLATAKNTVEALSDCDVLVRSLRRHVEEKNADTLDKMVTTRDVAFDQCQELFAELRTCAGGWMDVLMKNAGREAEREATLRASILDATERYHQADRDMYQQQLNETEHRRRLAETEVAACEAILRKNTTRMTALAMRRTDSNGSRPGSAAGPTANAYPSFGSRPATPQRTAAPRFAHQQPLNVESPTPQRTAPGRPPLTPATAHSSDDVSFTTHPNGTHSLVIHTSAAIPTPSHTPMHHPMPMPSPPPRSAGVPTLNATTDVVEYHPATLAAFHDAVNDMPIADIIALLPKSAATKEKWLVVLRDMDVEVGSELRGMRETAGVWNNVLLGQPLLKSLIEQVLDAPERFMELDDDSPKPTPTAHHAHLDVSP